MRVILDGDLLLYEVPFAAETGWRMKTGEETNSPPWDFVESILTQRIEYIKNSCEADGLTIYVSKGHNFRYDLAKRKPYKGNRKENKPWHRENVLAYMRACYDVQEIDGIEADDAMAIDHIASNGTTILASRDKDLMQVPGRFYRWELGRSPSWGPKVITKEGSLELAENHKKLSGTGMAAFYGQMLVGDTADNIPGCPDIGPVKAYELLNGKSLEEQLVAVSDCYNWVFGENAIQEFMEQASLLWLIKRRREDGSLVHYEYGMQE